jgi:hypothetical protein
LNGPVNEAEADGSSRPDVNRTGRAGAAGLDELLAEALRIDRAHRLKPQRPVSAETLRKQMRIGSMRGRALVQRIRDSHDAVQDTEPPGYRAQQVPGGDLPAGCTDEDTQQAPDRAEELAAVTP